MSRPSCLSELAMTFPVLDRTMPGAVIQALDNRGFASVAEWTHGQEESVRWAMIFVLSCWARSLPVSLGLVQDGGFRLFDALDSWDHEQKLAFAIWAKDPVRF